MTYTNTELEEIGARLIVDASEEMRTFERVPPGRGPDFLLAGEDGLVGLEITLLQRADDHSGRTRRAMEGMREQLLAGVRALWHSRGGPAIEVRVSFAGHRAPTKGTLVQDVERLATFVAARMPPLGSHVEFFPDWDEVTGLPECIARVSVVRFEELSESHWFGTDASFVPDLIPTQVQACIEAKELKWPIYASAAPETWLGIVLDGFRPSGHFTITDEVRNTPYGARFVRLFLVEAFRGIVIPLQRVPGGDAA